MKRFVIFVLILSVSLLVCFPAHAEINQEEVFQRLADLYDAELDYLERQQALWTKTISATADDYNSYNWFWNAFEFSTKPEDFARIHIYFCNTYGFSVEDAEPKDYFDPLRDAFGGEKAVFLVNQMVFSVTNADEIMAQAKKDILDQRSSGENADQNKILQDLYKATARIVEYAEEDNKDNYTQFSDRISDFREERRQMKSEYDFDFSWSSDSIIRCSRGLPAIDAVSSVYAKINQDKTYQQAVALEEEGHYYQAIKLYDTIGEFKDSLSRKNKLQDYVDHANELKVASIVKTPRNYNKKGEFVSEGTIVEKETYDYKLDGSFVCTYTKTGDLSEERTVSYDNKGKFVSGKKHTVVSVDYDTKKVNTTSDSVLYYDDHHNLIKEIKTYHVVKGQTSVFKDGLKLTDTYEYQYDEDGNILFETCVNGQANGSKTSKYQYSYEYDSNGNIIKCEKKGLGQSKYHNVYEYYYDDLGMIMRLESSPADKSKEGGYVVYTSIYTYEY